MTQEEFNNLLKEALTDNLEIRLRVGENYGGAKILYVDVFFNGDVIAKDHCFLE